MLFALALVKLMVAVAGDCKRLQAVTMGYKRLQKKRCRRTRENRTPSLAGSRLRWRYPDCGLEGWEFETLRIHRAGVLNRSGFTSGAESYGRARAVAAVGG